MKTFVDMLKEDIIIEKAKAELPDDVLRAAGFKIKLITPTAFGTQIDLAKRYKEEDIRTALDGFNIKIKNQSVFIVD